MKNSFILVAEDNETDIALFKRAARKAGIGDFIRFVEDGQHAMDYLAGRSKYGDRKLYPVPDIAIFDIKMPRKNGLEALEWVRCESRVKTLPVLILSCSSEERDIKRAYELGANAYLVKPIGLDAFGMDLKQVRGFWLETAVLPENR